jgi:hypothetical protein
MPAAAKTSEVRNLLIVASSKAKNDTVEERPVVQRYGPRLFAGGVMMVFLIVFAVFMSRAGSKVRVPENSEVSNKLLVNRPRILVTPTLPPFHLVLGLPTTTITNTSTTSTTTQTTTTGTFTRTTTTTTLHIFVPEAPVQEFYMYRAIADGDLWKYPFGNLNTGNLDGVMWYLANEVVTMYSHGPRCPRKFNIAKIHRFKVRTRATRELFNENLNMGARFSFDFGKCTGRCFPGNMCTGAADCDEHYGKFGFVVGCNNFYDHNPFPAVKTPAESGIWYSLPLAGRCDYPTGAHNCTWSYEDAGEIHLEELEATSPGGTNCCNWKCTSFWDGQFKESMLHMRVQKAEELFRWKFPNQIAPTGWPVCDFHPQAWYKEDNWPRRDPWGKATV